MAKNICILDYGLGNILSLKNAISHLGFQNYLFSDTSKKNFDCLIIPGVGSFAKAMSLLSQNGYKKIITETKDKNVLLKWDPQESFYYAAENTGFKPNIERTQGTYSRYSSIDDKIDWFHYYTTFIKFGIGRTTTDAVQEIRNNKITREEGVSLVRKYDNEFPSKYFQDFIEYVNVNEKEFWKIIDDHRSPHLWSLNETTKKWKLNYQVN